MSSLFLFFRFLFTLNSYSELMKKAITDEGFSKKEAVLLLLKELLEHEIPENEHFVFDKMLSSGEELVHIYCHVIDELAEIGTISAPYNYKMAIGDIVEKRRAEIHEETKKQIAIKYPYLFRPLN